MVYAKWSSVATISKCRYHHMKVKLTTPNDDSIPNTNTKLVYVLIRYDDYLVKTRDNTDFSVDVLSVLVYSGFDDVEGCI